MLLIFVHIFSLFFTTQALLFGNIASRVDEKYENLILNYLFKNNSNNESKKYFEVLNDFHIKLIKLANAECLKRTQGTIDEAVIDLSELSRNQHSLWLKYYESTNDTIEKSLFDNLIDTCFDAAELANLSSLYHSDQIENAEEILEFILLQYFKQGCNLCNTTHYAHYKLQRIQTWLYSISFVTIICLASLTPVLLIPFVNKQCYKKFLLVLIALAIGILCGSGFMHLIPRSYGIADNTYHKLHKVYIYKGLVTGLGIYMFYIIERILKILILKRNHKKISKKNSIKSIESNRNLDVEASERNDSDDFDYLENLAYIKVNDIPADPDVKIRVNLQRQNHVSNRQRDKKKRSIASVAWIVVFSDCFHKLIDGLTIGAAFTQSITNGVGLSTAIILEEIPHQLGDFAILTHAGVSYRRALIFQIFSSFCIYSGLVLGIFVGRIMHAAEWIYAMTGGIFIYIALIDMIPELHEIGEEIEISNQRFNKRFQQSFRKNLRKTNESEKKHQIINFKLKITIFLIQNAAIITGFTLMFILAILTN